MPATPTRRLALPAPVGGDFANVPLDLQKLAKSLDDVVLTYGHGPLASRPTGPEGFLYYATDTKTAYYCTAPDAWQPVMPLDAGGDLAGTWPAPSVAKISSDALPVHSDGSRLLVRRPASLPTTVSTALIGQLAHRGATITATVTSMAVGGGGGGGGVDVTRYTWTVSPTVSTGWRTLVPSAPTAEGAVGLEVQEVSGKMEIRIIKRRGLSTLGLVHLDIRGDAISWTTASGASTGTAAGPWPVGGEEATPHIRGALPNFNFTGIGGSTALLPTVPLNLTRAGVWELTATARIKLTTPTSPVQLAIGIAGDTPIAGNGYCLGGEWTAIAAGPVVVTAAAGTPVRIGLFAPGTLAAGTVYADVIARPLRWT